ncbi:MAG: ABC transporter ATP-binding protein [Hyphomicrobiaceae bacterium]
MLQLERDGPAAGVRASNAGTIIAIRGLTKTYDSGLQALKGIDLDIRRGEIFALLGPNGAGKTTLISLVCGLLRPTAGTVTVDGFDIQRDYREARSRIGLVPQELSVGIFDEVASTVAFSRGLFGKPRDDAAVERVLKSLALWDKRRDRIMTLSGGMKRRVLIAKALVHEPAVLFLDEPTAGVDVELRRGMWEVMRELSRTGTTIILTTHYIAEAEEMADRVGVITGGRIVEVDETAELMRKLGRKQLVLVLAETIDEIPPGLSRHGLALEDDGRSLVYSYDARAGRTGITRLIEDLRSAGIAFTDLTTRESSLEDIFVDLVRNAS